MPAIQSLVGFSLAFAGVLGLASVRAQEVQDSPDPTPQAARSVHLGWRSEPAEAFTTAITVRESTAGTYFCGIGFHRGYGGIQDSGNGRHVAIFSAWDPGPSQAGQGNPQETPEEIRTEVLALHDEAPQARFGGEGTGARCLYEFDWEPGTPVRLLLQGKPGEGEDQMMYRAWIQNGPGGEWELMAAYRTQQDDGPLHSFYSFVEDFRRNGETPHQRRLAEFGPTWVSRDGEWSVVPSAHFTGDDTPLDNVDSGPASEGALRLATGGDFAQENAPLWDEVQVDEEIPPTAEQAAAMDELLASPWPDESDPKPE